MDQNARLVKVEAFVETFREDLDRLHAADERLADEIAQQREHTDRSLTELRKHVDDSFAQQREHTDCGLAELRKYVDEGFAQQRAHTDQGLSELRHHTDQGFAELRKEFNTSIRWLVGLVLANMSMTLGLVAKSAGWF